MAEFPAKLLNRPHRISQYNYHYLCAKLPCNHAYSLLTYELCHIVVHNTVQYSER